MMYKFDKYNLHPKAKDNNNLDVNPPPEGHYGYIYRWTNLTSGIWYVGKHPFPFGDGYSHSSKNKDFLRDFTDRNIKWKYEIMEYIITNNDDLTIRENEMLSSMHDPKTGKGGASANPKSYNRSNGIPPKGKKQGQDLNLMENILELKKRIKSSPKFSKKQREVEELNDKINAGDFIQVRYLDDLDHVMSLKNILHREGNTDKSDPVVIFLNIWYRGKFYLELIGGSNHSLRAAKKAGMQTINCVFVEGKIVEEFIGILNDSNLELLCNSFNKQVGPLYKPNVSEDFQKWLENNYADNSINNKVYDINCNFSIAAGEEIFDLSRNQIGGIIRKTKSKIKWAESDLGKLWINYEIEPYDKILEKKKKSLNSLTGVRVRNWKTTQAAHAMWAEVLKDLNLIMKENKNKEKKDRINLYVIVLWYPNEKEYDKWNKIASSQMNISNSREIVSNLSTEDLKVEIEYMERLKSNR